MLETRSPRYTRAIERQLEYQKEKAQGLGPFERAYTETFTIHAREVKSRLAHHYSLTENTKILEVGCGAHGLIFFMGLIEGVGVDPLAHEYRRLFPQWQSRAHTVQAAGEDLPFASGSFEIVLSDNVVDHAEDPQKILHEIERVLQPGGLLYFTVNVHHPFWALMAKVHNLLQLLRVPFELAPFADHTYHFTLESARELISRDSFEILVEENSIPSIKRTKEGLGKASILKKLFFKNAKFTVIAKRKW